jgi:hypothetical protein
MDVNPIPVTEVRRGTLAGRLQDFHLGVSVIAFPLTLSPSTSLRYAQDKRSRRGAGFDLTSLRSA